MTSSFTESSPTTFSSLVAVTPQGEHRWSASLPDGWQQGRTFYGGLLAGMLCRAAEGEASSPERAIRSITAEMFAPVLPGPVGLQTELLRAGTGLSTVAVRLLQGGELCAHLVANIGKRREVGLSWVELRPPELPDWREMEPLAMGPPLAPVFTQHLVYRSASGPPYQGAGLPKTAGWVRLRDPGDRADAAWVCGLIDAWWPGMAERFTMPRPSATITFTVEILDGLHGLDPTEPLAFCGHTVALQEGYAVEFRELWTAGGQLVALNQQTMALLQ